MIAVSRNQKDSKGVNIEPDAKWLEASRRESEALVHSGKPAEFKDLYRHESVKLCLEQLFCLKCAYCEEKVTNGFDVEHYRPKAGISENAAHPGYYWLAYTWDNLLPSCQPCNQIRKDPPTWDTRTVGAAAGKGTQFPVSDESGRVFGPGPLSGEQPLLLDPCQHNPALHLSADALTGEILARENSQQGEATIAIVNLNRKRLKSERKATAQKLREAMLTTSEEQIKTRFLSPDNRFAGYCRILYQSPELLGLIRSGGQENPTFREP